jgi:hypothetical protein
MTKNEALKLALEALEDLGMKHYENTGEALYKETFTAIKEALAQPEQEPVAYIRVSKTGHVMACAKTGDFYSLPHKTLLYTTPPQRTWVGLTDKDWKRSKHTEDFEKGVDWAEAMLKAKNT